MADRVCAVIPAAGRGSRLGLDQPKILVEIGDGVTVWRLLHRRLRPHVDRLHAVVSPAAEQAFRRHAASEIRAGEVSVSVQKVPTGMGDAIFGSADHWRAYGTILVVWGDQVNLSAATVRRVVAAHRSTGPAVTIPLVSMPDPYVEYELDGDSLVRVRQSREGDHCRPGGLSDIGVFCLSTGGLVAAWERYLAGADPGATTGEVNFLPFLPHLSSVEGWPLAVVPVADVAEARGLNTLADLSYARQAHRRCPS